MDDTGNNKAVRLIQLSNFKPVEIIESYSRAKPYVSYGEENDYYDHIIQMYNTSPTNGALINGISTQIYGMGLSAHDAAKKPAQYAQMLTMFKKVDVRRTVNDLKLFGNAAMQIIWSKDHKTIVEAAHIPVESLRAEKANEDGEIEGYYYAKDWNDIYGKKKPIRYPAFGTSKEGLEIMFIKPYRAGSFYYSAPDYAPSLPYAELEKEISIYHINNTKNSFSPTTLINFNNGQAQTEEEKDDIERKVNNKFAGSGGVPILLSFNEGTESETTIETMQITDAHNQYQFLSEEAMKKLMIGHKVTSGILYGLNTNNGFSSNADEIKNASIFMYNTVIKGFQELLIDSFDKVLAQNEIVLDLFFKSIQPWKSEDEDEIEEENNNEETQTEQ